MENVIPPRFDLHNGHELSRYAKLSRVHMDEPKFVFPSPRYFRLRAWRLLNKVMWKRGQSYWAQHPLMDSALAHRYIHDRIVAGTPTAVGRIGNVEAMIGLWANRIPLPFFPFGSIPSPYWETSLGATNAGIRPRNRHSYRAFGDLLLASVRELDLMGVWRTMYEAPFLNHLESHPLLADVEGIGPAFSGDFSWMSALDGKHLLVISPFIDSFEKQHLRLREVWPAWKKIPHFTMTGVKFPYLIEDDCPVTWWEVYTEMAKIIKAGQYDVALMGCGGLGLPLAALARQTGRIGFHLGGQLQLLFGVYGNRFLEQPWYRELINEAWVRPAPHEVPLSSERVENKCYW